MAGRPEKFSALRQFLQQKAEQLRETYDTGFSMTFDEIEALGARLPASAYKHRAWWTNNYYRPGNINNNNSKVWERAGFRTREVNLKARRVSFERKGPFTPEELTRQDEKRRAALANLLKKRRPHETLPSSLPSSMPHGGLSETARGYSAGSNKKPETVPGLCRHPLYGALKGHLRLVAGTDLTKPADPEWGERVWGKDDKK